MDDIEIQVWREPWTRHNELLDGWLNFWIHEPLNSGVEGDFDDDRKEKLALMLYDLLNSDHKTPLIAAWDRTNQKVAGFIISVTMCKDVEAHSLPGEVKMKPFEAYGVNDKQAEQMKNLESFLHEADMKGDLFDRLGIDKYWYIMATSVCKEYTRRGINHQLTTQALQEAMKAGHTTVASTSNSEYTQRNKVKRHQFVKICELDFENNYLNYSSMPEEMRTNHDRACILVKTL